MREKTILFMLLFCFFYGAYYLFVYSVYNEFYIFPRPLKYSLFSSYLFFVLHSSFLLLFIYALQELKKIVKYNFTHLLSFLLTCLTLFVLIIIVGYRIGLTHWGAPVNLSLLLELIREYKSFTGIFAIIDINKIHIFAAMSGLFGLYLVNFLLLQKSAFLYNYSKKWKKAFSRIKLLLLIGIITTIINYKTNLLNIAKRNNIYNIKRYEMLSSFFFESKPVGRTTSMNWGDKLTQDSFEKIDSFNRKNVVLISVDCLRADHLSFRSYERKTTPYLDSLYRNGVLKDFDIMTSSCNNSFGGILSTLNSANIQSLNNFKFGIHDYLKKQGYNINFLVSGMHSNFYNLKYHYGTNIDFYLEGSDLDGFNLNDDLLLLEGLSQIPNYTGEPNFFFIHLMSPHILGDVHDEYQKFKPTFSPHNGFSQNEKKKYYFNNYDNGIYQSDHIIKGIIETLTRKGYWENSVTIITGDHGESLGEDETFGHCCGLRQCDIGIPILIIDKDTSIYKEQDYATQIDIGPTIVSRLELPIPSHWHGKSLIENHDHRLTYHEQVPCGNNKASILSIIEKNKSAVFKYLINNLDTTEYFFDLSIDPNERINYIDSLKNTDRYNIFQDAVTAIKDETKMIE